MGEAVSIIFRSAARYLKEMVSLTHSFVAIIYDSAELREVRRCQRYLQERRPSHWVMMWPYIE